MTTTDKSHRTIGKCARDFDALLAQRAAPPVRHMGRVSRAVPALILLV